MARGVELAGDVGAVVVRGMQRGGVGADVWVVKGVLVVLVLRAVVAEGVAVAGHVAGVAGAGGQRVLLAEGAAGHRPRRRQAAARQTTLEYHTHYIHQTLHGTTYYSLQGKKYYPGK